MSKNFLNMSEIQRTCWMALQPPERGGESSPARRAVAFATLGSSLRSPLPASKRRRRGDGDDIYAPGTVFECSDERYAILLYSFHTSLLCQGPQWEHARAEYLARRTATHDYASRPGSSCAVCSQRIFRHRDGCPLASTFCDAHCSCWTGDFLRGVLDRGSYGLDDGSGADPAYDGGPEDDGAGAGAGAGDGSDSPAEAAAVLTGSHVVETESILSPGELLAETLRRSTGAGGGGLYDVWYSERHSALCLSEDEKRADRHHDGYVALRSISIMCSGGLRKLWVCSCAPGCADRVANATQAPLPYQVLDDAVSTVRTLAKWIECKHEYAIRVLEAEAGGRNKFLERTRPHVIAQVAPRDGVFAVAPVSPHATVVIRALGPFSPTSVLASASLESATLRCESSNCKGRRSHCVHVHAVRAAGVGAASLAAASALEAAGAAAAAIFDVDDEDVDADELGTSPFLQRKFPLLPGGPLGVPESSKILFQDVDLGNLSVISAVPHVSYSYALVCQWCAGGRRRQSTVRGRYVSLVYSAHARVASQYAARLYC